jgi:hypothetical protein
MAELEKVRARSDRDKSESESEMLPSQCHHDGPGFVNKVIVALRYHPAALTHNRALVRSTLDPSPANPAAKHKQMARRDRCSRAWFVGTRQYPTEARHMKTTKLATTTRPGYLWVRHGRRFLHEGQGEIAASAHEWSD